MSHHGHVGVVLGGCISRVSRVAEPSSGNALGDDENTPIVHSHRPSPLWLAISGITAILLDCPKVPVSVCLDRRRPSWANVLPISTLALTMLRSTVAALQAVASRSDHLSREQQSYVY